MQFARNHRLQDRGRPRRGKFALSRLLLLLLFFVVAAAGAQSVPPRSIRVVMDDNYPPFVFRDSEGGLQGILIDQWRLWERQTGVRAQLSAMDWNEAVRRMQAGEFDVIDTIFRTDERAAWLDFAKPYGRIDVPIFFDQNISGITDLASLKGFAVAAKAGDAAVDLLRRNGVTTVLLFNNYESIVTAAAQHKVNVFVVDKPAALYYLNKLQISSRFRYSAAINVGEFHRATRQGERDMLRMVERGFARIDAADLKRIDEKWYGASIQGDDYFQYLGYGAVVVFALILSLLFWNRTLSQMVNRRTAALRESESRLRAILQAEPEGVQMVAPDGRLLEMNPAGLAMLEAASLPQAQQRKLAEFVVPGHRSAFQDLHDRLLRGENGTLEFEIEGLQGTRRWLATHATALRDATGNVATLLGVTQDITERKQVEALTAGQMRVLEMIAADAPLVDTLNLLLHVIEAQSPGMLCSVLLVDADNRVRHCAAPGLPKAFTQAIDGSPIGPKAGSCGTAAFRRERVFVADIVHDPLWEDYRHLAEPHGLRACWSTPIFDPQNKVLGTFAIYYKRPGLPQERHLRLIESTSHTATICLNRHRTKQALRESEERFRQVVENIAGVYWMTDVVKKRMLYVSPSYEKTWGRSCVSLHRSPHEWLEAVHPEDRKRVRQAMSKQARGEYQEEYRVVRPDGTVRWIRDCAFPIHDSSGEVYRIAGVAEDITERRELEEQFRQSQKMEAMGALAAGIAHDFNNILSVINGNAELALQDVAARHPALASLNEILKAGCRARNLVQQILTFTRLQQPQRQVIALGPLVNETVAFLRVTLPASVDLSVALAADAPNVLVNATQVQQVLLNLCTNAWHALEGEAGSIEVQLRSVPVDAEMARRRTDLQVGLYACLSVRDTGTGMDEATQNRIFEPFFTTKSQGQGTGLGLSVAHGIMSSHQGAIVVASELGTGTTIQLYFPAADGPAADLPAAEGPFEAPVPVAEVVSPQGRGQRILYIDDEEPLVVLTTRTFERLGYAVSGFTEADAALAAFRAEPHQFDLAVTDFNMPGTSGLEVAGKLMSIRPDLPIVLTSGYVNDDLVAKAHSAGIRHVIYKPSTVKEFCDAVQRVLHDPKEVVPSG